jgi:hypothetical protein
MFEEGVRKRIHEITIKLCKKFQSDIPIVDEGTTPDKIAKIGVALAAMTFSHAEDSLSRLVVRMCHVDCAETILNNLYSSTTLGYKDFSKTSKLRTLRFDKAAVEDKMNYLNSTFDFSTAIFNEPVFDSQDIRTWAAIDENEAEKVVGFLLHYCAIVKVPAMTHKPKYQKTSVFIEFLREYTERNSGSRVDNTRPPYLGENEKEF